MAGRLWTTEEIALLYDMRERQGEEFPDIAPFIGRSAAACRAQAQSQAYQDMARAERMADELKVVTLEDLKAHSPVVRVEPRVGPSSGSMLEVDFMDHHFAMLAWGRETHGPDYDLKIARRLWHEKLEEVAQVAEAYDVDYIVLPTGNDLVHFDSGWGVAGSGGSSRS